jgi:hypothetical protein
LRTVHDAALPAYEALASRRLAAEPA